MMKKRKYFRRLSNLPKVTELANGTAEIQI